jgi:glycosyltransferase involved in cell wall biosynthesis
MDPDCQEGLASVVLPTYNRAHFLPDAIGSVIDQTYRPVELLVVDDGSTDDTREVVEELADRSDAELTIRFLSQSKQGAPAARNLGLLNSRGEFIQFLDSDDIMHPQKLEVQIRILRSHREAEYAWADFHWAREKDFTAFNATHRNEYDIENVIQKAWIGTGSAAEVWTGLYRRSACRRIGPWNETLERWQDREYNFRFDCLNPKSVWSTAKLYKNRGHDEGRIINARFESEGVSRGIHTVEVMQGVANDMEIDSLRVNLNLRGLYFQLAREALKSGTNSQVELTLRRAIRNSNSGFDSISLELLYSVYRVLGKRSAHHLLRAYSHLRGAH